MGLVYFLTNVFLKHASDDDAVTNFVEWASGLALDIIRTTIDNIPSLCCIPGEELQYNVTWVCEKLHL